MSVLSPQDRDAVETVLIAAYVTYREALDRVISAAVFYYIDDVRSQPDLKTGVGYRHPQS